jgi:AbrB family looped-hinge helix DNA binding protein
VTTTLSARGQIVIPSDVRKKFGFKQGDDFIVLTSPEGEILLKPIRHSRRKGLFQAFRALKGLKLPPRNKEQIRSIEL